MPDTFRIADLIFKDHWLEVPLDYRNPQGPTLRIYGREVVLRKKVADEKLPWAVFFQGGPGFESPRVLGKSGWFKPVLESYRLFLPDPRGTGRSSGLSAREVAALGDAVAQAEHVRHFRQDNIVRDAEAFRAKLTGGKPWLAIGQSFGGWCIASYLSFYPEGLSGAVLCGGMPPVGWAVDDVYRATYPQAEKATRDLYARFPALQTQFAGLAAMLAKTPAPLPRGGVLSLRGLQHLGLQLYRGQGAEALQYLLEKAFPSGNDAAPVLTDAFLYAVETILGGFATNPFFLVLHEAIYADGPGLATGWSAQRVRAQFPQFDAFDGETLLLTGEHMFPWMADEFPGAAPLKGVAELLAAKQDWEPLYDAARLQNNRVPAAAIIYHDDLCVAYDYSHDFSKRLGGLKRWITSEYAHDGIGVDGERIMTRLLGMVEGDVASY